MGQAAIESRTGAIGRELLQGARTRQPRLGSRAWIDDRLMALSMRDEQVKIRLFRFVDALPGLTSTRELTRHLGEYLLPVAGGLPRVVAWTVRHLDDHALQALVGWAARLGSRQLARRFIVGDTVPATVAAVARLRARQRCATVDLLGEAILSEDEAAHYQGRYLELITALADAAASWPADALLDHSPTGSIPKVNVSVKLSALTGRFEPCDEVGTSRRVRSRLRPILALAQARGVFINIDMEQSSYKPATVRILTEILDEEAFRSWHDIGIAIQAYLRSTAADLQHLHDWAQARGRRLWIRLVKGAYWDYERAIAEQNDWVAPVFTDKAATDANYEALSAWLLERRAVLRPAFASHNVRSIAHVLAVAEELHIPQGELEFQMLYGMADALQETVVARGERLRVYAPFGELLPGMAYLVRRLLENTSNQSFVRAGFLEHTAEEQLLMNPRSVPALAPAELPAGNRFINQAPLDFSDLASRGRIEAALAALALEPPRIWPVVIGNLPQPVGRTVATHDPSQHATVLGQVAYASQHEAMAAVAQAAQAGPAWRDQGAAARAALLHAAADGLVRRRFELCAWMVREVGKTWREADGDLCEAVDFCRYYAAGAEALERPSRVDLPGEENDWLFDPCGVAIVIAPWNFPLAILCGMTTAALAVGCTVVMKPAEQSSIIAGLLMQVFIDAGFPPGVVNLVTGSGEELGPSLIDHPATAVVAFTGSRAVGLAITRQATALIPGRDHLVRVICEMGGKNAIIVDDDADLDDAVLGVMASAFGYQGQKCSACSRAIVLPQVYERFLARLIAAVQAWPMAKAADPAHGIGPVIDADAYTRIRAAIARGATQARLAYAGDAGTLAGSGYYIPPHIFAEVPETSFLAQEEIFGPVLSVMAARDLDHALALANGTRYALTGGCYSRSPSTLERVRREFRVGNLYLNRRITGALVGRQPFGGFRLSGGGTKAGGPDYLQHFVVPRAITENTMRHGFAPQRHA